LARGLSVLTVHPALMQSAQSQAAYMAATGNVTHERPWHTYTQQTARAGFSRLRVIFRLVVSLEEYFEHRQSDGCGAVFQPRGRTNST